MDGAALTSAYDLEPSPYGYLLYETQRRTPKMLRQLEVDIQKLSRSSNAKMFDGKKLEVDAKSKDYDLDRFCTEVKEGIESALTRVYIRSC